MRRLITISVWVASAAFVAATVAGCACCSSPNPTPETAMVQVPPQQPAEIPPAPEPPAAPAPMEIPAPPPAPVPLEIHEPPTVDQPPKTELSKEVTKAIEDLGTKYPGLFTFDSERGMFRFNSDITFDSGSSTVKPQARAALTKLAEILNGDQAKDRQLTIIGYTDSVPVRKATTIALLRQLGQPATNMGLSEARADAVEAVLSAGGVAGSRMTTRGKGASNPVASNATAAGRAQNRRVEIYLTPMAP